jgi:RNA polymerase sigma-70 factor (ECF subfamily)
MFRLAQNLWFDRKGTDKFPSEPVDVEVAESLASSDAWAVPESKLVFTDLLKALDRLSPEHRTLIALVCVSGLTYSEAAEILSLPVATVMSRLARGRLVLHGAVDKVTASRAARH